MPVWCRIDGASAVELALVLPILVAVLLGIFDFGQAYVIKQNLTASAREGARMAIAARPVTDDEVRQRVEAFLADANVVESVTVTITPSATGAASGTAIVVEATTPFPLTVLPRTLTIAGRARMVKE